jgi:hypothetical protein
MPVSPPTDTNLFFEFQRMALAVRDPRHKQQQYAEDGKNGINLAASSMVSGAGSQPAAAS